MQTTANQTQTNNASQHSTPALTPALNTNTVTPL